MIGGELRLPVPNSDIANVRQQTPPEELANTVTHGIGVIFSIGGLIFLVMKAVAHGTAAESYRLGAVSNRLGACDPWVCFKGDLPAAFCETDLVFVFGDGMADRFRGRGNFREFVTTRHSLVSRGRVVLFNRNHLFHPRSDQIHARCLACVRIGRKHLSFFGSFLWRDPDWEMIRFSIIPC